MRTNLFMILCISILSTGMVSIVHAQQEPDRAKEKELPAALQLAESWHFLFEADRAFPTGGGRSIDMMTRPNQVEVMGDSARGDLAFFGKAQNAGYDTEGGGIRFDGEMGNKKIKHKERRNQVMLSFSVRGTRDSHTCYFTISANGSCTLSVNSNYRSTITYNGKISALTEKKP